MSVQPRDVAPGITRAPVRYDNRITLQKLEVFCSVVDLGGVSRAAEHLWVAQSVVSGHLRSLQDRLGVQVLYREGQVMKMTKAGEEVYRWATETLSGTRDLMRTLEDLDEATSARLTLATSLTAGGYLLPPILAELQLLRHNASISMTVADPEVAFAAVGTGECDLGIVLADTGHEHPHVRCEVLGREEIVLVVGPGALPGIDELPLAGLADLALVSPPAGNIGRELVDRQIAARGAETGNVTMEVGHPEAMKRVVRSGIGAALLFRSCVADDLAHGMLRELRFTDADLSLPVLSVTRGDRRPTSIQTQLVELIRAHLAAK